MGKYDSAILELLEDAGVAMPPKAIAFNLDYRNIASPAKSTVQRRLGILEDHDLVEKVDPTTGYYDITDRGKSYLEGKIDVKELEDVGQ